MVKEKDLMHFTPGLDRKKRISTDLVEFKSTTEFYIKEKNGQKPNTVRVFDALPDEREKTIRAGKARRIRITNAETGESFERIITDISKWEDITIISWKHLEAQLAKKSKAYAKWLQKGQQKKLVD